VIVNTRLEVLHLAFLGFVCLIHVSRYSYTGRQGVGRIEREVGLGCALFAEFQSARLARLGNWRWGRDSSPSSFEYETSPATAYYVVTAAPRDRPKLGLTPRPYQYWRDATRLATTCY